jgi:hypothetical protein
LAESGNQEKILLAFVLVERGNEPKIITVYKR